VNETYINAMIERVSGLEYHLQNGIGGYSEVKVVHLAFILAVIAYMFILWWLAFQRRKESLIGKVLDVSILVSIGISIYMLEKQDISKIKYVMMLIVASIAMLFIRYKTSSHYYK